MKRFDPETWTPQYPVIAPYSARATIHMREGIFLDANENPFEKETVIPILISACEKGPLRKEQVPLKFFIGTEVTNNRLIYRIFCEPQQDRVIICPPTYGMYEVSANSNNIEVILIPLNDQFEMDIDKIYPFRLNVSSLLTQ
jgi:histidinol-phosphate aminotransferase